MNGILDPIPMQPTRRPSGPGPLCGKSRRRSRTMDVMAMRENIRKMLRKAGDAGLVCLILVAAAACGLEPDPPPAFDRSDFGGTGDKMAQCMAFASQSYCEQEIWGGNER